MLTFADAKRVLETTRKHSPAIVGLCLELIAMLEENAAGKYLEYEKALKEAEASREKAQLFAASHDYSVELAEAKERIEELEKELLQYRAQKELLQHRAQKKRGRPKKAETYASEVDDLREDFGVKDLAKELASMKED